MKDKNGNELVFVINNEESQYLEHIKKYAFRDNYPKPNRNDFNIESDGIGKFVKLKDTGNINNANTNSVNPTKPEPRNIHEGHRKRLREMFNKVNPLSLPENQILELMLSFVQPQKDVNPLAHKLLNEFGSFANVLDANIDDLKRINGVGDVLANYIHFCSKIPLIYNESKINYRTKLTLPSEIVDFVRSKIVFNTEEEFYYLCLNNKGNVLCFKNLGIGTVSKLYVDNRILIQNILKYPTNTVVICHTHPHGNSNPSVEDITFTENLFSLLEKLNIKLADHIIVSPSGFYSFFMSHDESLGKHVNFRNKILYDLPPTPLD